jgi:hypothetical protein
VRSVQQFAGLAGTSARLASIRLSVSVSINARLEVGTLIPMPDDRGGTSLRQPAETPAEKTRETTLLAVGHLGSGRHKLPHPAEPGSRLQLILELVAAPDLYRENS